MATQLATDQQRVLGPEHVDTLSTLGNLAMWTGEAGDAQTARQMFSRLLDEQWPCFSLGRDHPDTLSTWARLAAWTGRAGNPEEARWPSGQLLDDQLRLRGPDDPRHV